ncbi:hypothetical protein Nepgr_012996 [Nepenthes gracilis]|uniref:SHSP domain-containing protein n=1 Tax=Nepenthes gracilis TaxID=150966 RepID=A0AAD3SHX3_NEPGR|nr:hypothetical protein Nepgr_012996 [Nepenthes gracilis]
MDARARAASTRVYEDFEPTADWIHEEGVDTYLVYLPDFKKENLRVQLTTSRVLKISGECPISENRWKRFLKEVRVSENCNTKEITAKFEEGVLYIRQPKLITPAEKQEKEKSTVDAPRPQQPKSNLPSQQDPSLPPQDKKFNGSSSANGIPKTTQEENKEDPKKIVENSRGEKENVAKEEMREAKEEEEETSKTTNDARKMEEEVIQRKESEGKPAVVSGKFAAGGFFEEVKKPGNLKKLIAIVALGMLLGLFIINMRKSCQCDNQGLSLMNN